MDPIFGDFNSRVKPIRTMFSHPSPISRDASANDPTEAFIFSQTRRSALLLPPSSIPNRCAPTAPCGTISARSAEGSETTAGLSGTSTNTFASGTSGGSTREVNERISVPVIQEVVSIAAAFAVSAISKKTGLSRNRSDGATPKPRPPPSDGSPAGGDRTTLNHRCGNLGRCTSRPTLPQPSPGSGQETVLLLPHRTSLPKASIRPENGSSTTLRLIQESTSGRSAGGLD